MFRSPGYVSEFLGAAIGENGQLHKGRRTGLREAFNSGQRHFALIHLACARLFFSHVRDILLSSQAVCKPLLNQWSSTMLHRKYRKVSGSNVGHTYSIHDHGLPHGQTRKVHQWLLCRDSDVFDRHLVEEKDLDDGRLWQWLE